MEGFIQSKIRKEQDGEKNLCGSANRCAMLCVNDTTGKVSPECHQVQKPCP